MADPDQSEHPDPFRIPEEGQPATSSIWGHQQAPDGNANSQQPGGGQQFPPPGGTPPESPLRAYNTAQYPAPPDLALPHTYNRGTNGFAVAALIFGILGGLLAFIFGSIALSQLNKRGGQGRGLAIAGMVIAAVWVVGIVLVVVVAVVNGADRNDAGSITSSGKVAADDLKVGDCLTDIPEGDVISSFDAAPCSEAHQGEVYAIFELAGDDYPGDQDVVTQAEYGCYEKLDAATSTPDEYGLYYLHPQEPTWDLDREVVCVAATPWTTTGTIADN